MLLHIILTRNNNSVKLNYFKLFVKFKLSTGQSFQNKGTQLFIVY